MDPNPNEIVREFPRRFRVYKDGRVERFRGIETTPAGTNTQTGVQSKDVIINPVTGVSARLFLPKSAQKLPLLIYIHGGAFCNFTPFNPDYLYKDGLRDRGLAYGKTLNKSGWSGSVEVVETPGEDHVFHMFNFDSEETKSLLKRIADFIVQV